jgi:hypothetical protein
MCTSIGKIGASGLGRFRIGCKPIPHTVVIHIRHISSDIRSMKIRSVLALEGDRN